VPLRLLSQSKWLVFRPCNGICNERANANRSYMLKIRLPEEVMECAAMKALWRETVYICLILNDVYSVQKEIVSIELCAQLGFYTYLRPFSNTCYSVKARF